MVTAESVSPSTCSTSLGFSTCSRVQRASLTSRMGVSGLRGEGNAGPHTPVVRHIEVSDLSCRKAKYALSLRG